MNFFALFIALQVTQIKVLQTAAQCNLTPCEVYDMFSKAQRDEEHSSSAPCTNDIQFRQLDRRLRAIEQPVWTISYSHARWRQCTKNTCRCDAVHRSLNCWRAGLTALTTDLIVPADLFTIDLGTNKLRTLHKTTFKGMRSLTELDMFDNHVEYLPPGIFDSLTNLRILILLGKWNEEECQREYRFTEIKILTNRFLNRNSPSLLSKILEQFSRTEFAHAILSEDIIFDGCYLQGNIVISEKGRLQRNYLEEIDSELFRSTKRLFHVDLSNNYLYTLPERLFTNNSYLETVDFSNNQIVYIPSDTFIGLNSLLILDLSRNKIQRIENGTFVLKHLQILKLSDNNIGNITENAFESLTLLETLLLDKNDLQTIPSNLFCNLKCLTFLDLSSNNILFLTGREFHKLVLLRNLDLKENAISELPDDVFSRCLSLEKLDLSKNKLRFINVTTFDGLHNLTSLILSDNQIHEIHFKTFATLKNLTTLYLDNNMIPSLPSRALDYMPKLANVKLSNNPWHCDCHALYVSAWVRLNEMKIWDYSPTCVSPWYLEGHFLKKLKFPELCTGQWASMVNLAPRLPMQQLMSLNVSINKKPQESSEHNLEVTSVDENWH